MTIEFNAISRAFAARSTGASVTGAGAAAGASACSAGPQAEISTKDETMVAIAADRIDILFPCISLVAEVGGRQSIGKISGYGSFILKIIAPLRQVHLDGGEATDPE